MYQTKFSPSSRYWAGEGNCSQEKGTEKDHSCLFSPNLLIQSGSSFWLCSRGHLVFQCAFCLVLYTYGEEMGGGGSIELKLKATTGLPMLHQSLCPGPHRKAKHQGRIPLPLYFPIHRSHTSGERIEFIQSISDSFSNSLFMASREVCSVASYSAFLSWWRQEKEWVSNA